MSLRDKILAAKDIETELVPIPQWGVTVEVRGMTGRQRTILLQDTIDSRGRANLEKLYPRLVILSTFDPETGEPVFQEGDADAIAEKSSGAIEAITKVAQRLSGLDQAEAAKNSETAQSDSSVSA